MFVLNIFVLPSFYLDNLAKVENITVKDQPIIIYKSPYIAIIHKWIIPHEISELCNGKLSECIIHSSHRFGLLLRRQICLNPVWLSALRSPIH